MASAAIKSIHFVTMLMTNVRNTPTQGSEKPRRISEIFAMMAIILLVVFFGDVLVGQNGQGFLPMSSEQRGISFGSSAATLFFISFGLGFRVKTRLTRSLLLSGGGLLAGFMLVAPKVGLLLYLVYALQGTHIMTIAIGFFIIVPGIVRVNRKQ